MPFKALVVDDEPAVLSLLRDLLESRSFEVSTAPSATAAIQVLAKGPFDLVVTDMRMETSTAGYDVVHQAKALPHSPVVVILTAFPLPPNEWRSSGADAMFMKGGGVFRVLDEIERLVRLQSANVSRSAS